MSALVAGARALVVPSVWYEGAPRGISIDMDIKPASAMTGAGLNDTVPERVWPSRVAVIGTAVVAVTGAVLIEKFKAV